MTKDQITQKTKTAQAKTSVRIWAPVLKKLEGKFEDACIRRDAYLAKVFAREVEYLEKEVEIPNSQASYDHIASLHREARLPLISIALPRALTERINEVCKQKNIVRDAFFNRVLLLLAIDPKHLDRLMFPLLDRSWVEEFIREIGPDQAHWLEYLQPLRSDIDPFDSLRCVMKWIEQEESTATEEERLLAGKIAEDELPNRIYTTVFKEKSSGDSGVDMGLFNCHLPAHMVPGSDAEKKHEAELDALMKTWF